MDITMQPETIKFIFLALVVTITFFLMVREIVCWYFKINERVELSKKTIDNQIRIIKMLELTSKPIHIGDIDMSSKHDQP